MKARGFVEKKKSSSTPALSKSILLSTRAFDAIQPKLETPVQPSAPLMRDHNLKNIAFPVQAKLTIGEPNDKYEQEADRVAAQVVQKINAPQPVEPNSDQPIQRQAMSDEDEELQMKPMLQRREAIGGGAATTELESSINQARGGGQALDVGLQRSMGRAMGADFSRVRVHTGGESDRLNRSIQAKAFTTGQDVFFRQGAYQPGSLGGQELIAHELTHVVQQNSSSLSRKIDFKTVQRAGNDIMSGGIDGLKEGAYDSTLGRFKKPQARIGTFGAFQFIASVILTPFLTDRPPIPNVLTPYLQGYGMGLGIGFVGGTVLRKAIFKALARRTKMPAIMLIDTLMTVSSVNNMALKLDDFHARNPKVKPYSDQFVAQVAESAKQQHNRTNPYMTPNSPESNMETQSLF